MPPHVTCKACAGEWPRKDHWIADFGLTQAYLFDDQFFPGWTVLVLRRHATELFDLTSEERSRLIEDVSEVALALAMAFEPVKINYELLGNQLPHIHWHVIPRLAVWTVRHEPIRLAPEELGERISRIRSHLKIEEKTNRAHQGSKG
jgi:diadenosine tetraphosphate (Ap4A) HIT family hydrolase